ncbi:MAG: exosortase/archaeosortase family protein [Candidatus Poseidoniaceae archaeon]|jgi:exosortase/archaeosortase family protein|nr:exosortase/archaeosortase family protein [Candidatus Poseidoniaceae archaeon]
MGEGQDDKLAPKSNPSTNEIDDLSWSEVGVLAKSYLRIPVALILVEMFYWFITQPTNTLGLIQESEAWIWYELTELIYGSGTATLSEYNGWTTMVTLHHADFWADRINLYVSDECAGVHEMIFISVLMIMTTGVPQRLRIKSALIACGVVYVVNIARLLVLYPMAVSGCNENPNLFNCEKPMHDFHTFFYEWGFLLLLVLIWLLWFKWVNAGNLIQRENNRSKGKWKFIYRNKWQDKHKIALVISVLLIIGAFANVMLDNNAMDAKEAVDTCEFYSSVTGSCGDARDIWAQEIQSSWSLATLGFLGLVGTVVTIDKPKEIEEE